MNGLEEKMNVEDAREVGLSERLTPRTEKADVRRILGRTDAPRYVWRDSPLGPVEVRVNGVDALLFSANKKNAFAWDIRVNNVRYHVIAHIHREATSRGEVVWGVNANAGAPSLTRVDGKDAISWEARKKVERLAREAARRFADMFPDALAEGEVVDLQRQVARSEDVVHDAERALDARRKELEAVQERLHAARLKYAAKGV